MKTLRENQKSKREGKYPLFPLLHGLPLVTSKIVQTTIIDRLFFTKNTVDLNYIKMRWTIKTEVSDIINLSLLEGPYSEDRQKQILNWKTISQKIFYLGKEEFVKFL